MQVIKKSGENLLAATDQIFGILDETRESGAIPAELTVTLTNDQSETIRMQGKRPFNIFGWLQNRHLDLLRRLEGGPVG